MSIYMSRLFPRSNSILLLSGGNALQSQVLRLREEMFLADAGPGAPRIRMEDVLTRVPANRATTRFENKVGHLDAAAGESSIKNRVLERFFTDLVAGDPLNKERAAAKFNDLVGSTDVAPGEPILILPRRFRQTQAWTELKNLNILVIYLGTLGCLTALLEVRKLECNSLGSFLCLFFLFCKKW